MSRAASPISTYASKLGGRWLSSTYTEKKKSGGVKSVKMLINGELRRTLAISAGWQMRKAVLETLMIAELLAAAYCALTPGLPAGPCRWEPLFGACWAGRCRLFLHRCGVNKQTYQLWWLFQFQAAVWFCDSFFLYTAVETRQPWELRCFSFVRIWSAVWCFLCVLCGAPLIGIFRDWWSQLCLHVSYRNLGHRATFS